jgi:hypothetical protein
MSRKNKIYTMSLIGTYSCPQLGAKLVIKEANNDNGKGSGTFTIGNLTIQVSINYHWKNNGGPETVYEIWASDFNGYDYVGAAGHSSDTDASKGIMLVGGLSNVDSTHGFSGLFKK